MHGNKFGLPKLIKEFREFWYIKEGGKPTPEEPAETQSPAADGEKDPASPDKPDVAKKYSISKSQLDKTIKEIAVYEKRATFKKLCWYVNDDVLEKYNLKDLPVPTTWHWVTRENPPPPTPKSESPMPTPAQGRVTPKNTPKQITSSITKFTVAGVTPKVYEPTPVKPTPVKPSEEGSTPKAANKKSIVDMFSKVPPKSAKPLQPETATENIIKIGDEGEDSDCAIVGLELKADKNQPSVKSMFKPATKRKSMGKVEATEAKRKPVEEDSKNEQTTAKKPSAVSKVETKSVAPKPLAKKTPAKASVKKKVDTEAKASAKKAPGTKKTSVVKKPRTIVQSLVESKDKKDDKPANGNIKGNGSENSPMEID